MKDVSSTVRGVFHTIAGTSGLYKIIPVQWPGDITNCLARVTVLNAVRAALNTPCVSS